VRTERIALHHSRARKLAWPTLDRLLVAICPKRFSEAEFYEDHPKSKFHARGSGNSPGITDARLINPSNTQFIDSGRVSFSCLFSRIPRKPDSLVKGTGFGSGFRALLGA